MKFEYLKELMLEPGDLVEIYGNCKCFIYLDVEYDTWWGEIYIFACANNMDLIKSDSNFVKGRILARYANAAV